MERSAELLVGNGQLITQDEHLPWVDNGCVAVRDGLIVAVGPTAKLRHAHRAARFVDAQGKLILPGLINAHTQLYRTFARGLAAGGAAPAHGAEPGAGLCCRLEQALSLDAIYWSAMAAMLDAIRNGVTTLFDQHSSPHAIAGSLFRIAEAACLTGVRSCLSYQVSDREGESAAAQGLAENRAHLEFCAKSENLLHRGLVGIDASPRVGDATLAQCADLAREFGVGIHAHTAEAAADAAACEREHGRRIVERWEEFGVLGPRSLAADCLHVNEHELDLLTGSQTNIVHNPQISMAQPDGAAPVQQMMRRGLRVGLGTGGSSSDLFESMRLAQLLLQQANTPGAGWCEPPQMLFRANAALASECFGQIMGRLVPGAVADLIVADYAAPTPLNAGNLHQHLLLGMRGRAVATTIIGGEVLMEEREFLTIDEHEVMWKARAAAAEVWKRL